MVSMGSMHQQQEEGEGQISNKIEEHEDCTTERELLVWIGNLPVLDLQERRNTEWDKTELEEEQHSTEFKLIIEVP